MRVAVVSSTVFPCPPSGYAGLEAIAYHIAAGLVRKGHRVSLIAPEGSRLDSGELILTGPPGTWDEARAFQHYRGELHKFDCVIDHSWTKPAYLLKADGSLKCPVLGVMHAPVNTMYQSLPPVAKPCFVCISQDQANHFNALFAPAQAKVAYNGIDLDFYKPIEGVKRSNRFLFLARFSTIKGPDLAIEACRKAGVGLDLIGDTSITNEPEFFRRCEELCDWTPQRIKAETVYSGKPREKWVRMVGPASRGECVWWFSQAHCLLHPNQRFREPFGLAPVEAMACGCPVVAWDNGAMRETVGKDVGWLVRSFDELVSAVQSLAHPLSSTGQKQREATREWASQFSIQNMVDRYESLCHEAIQGGGW